MLLLILAALHNLSRTIGTAMLFAVSKPLTTVFILGEMAVYHLYKLARNDYAIWIPGVEGTLMWIASFVVHSVVKVLVDFTGLVHARGPKLAGGFAFLFMTVYSQCYPFVALYFYSTSSGVENKTSPHDMNTGLIFLASLWGCCVVAFFAIIKREKLSTFYSFLTAWQVSVSHGGQHDMRRDETRMKLIKSFSNHSARSSLLIRIGRATTPSLR